MILCASTYYVVLLLSLLIMFFLSTELCFTLHCSFSFASFLCHLYLPVNLTTSTICREQLYSYISLVILAVDLKPIALATQPFFYSHAFILRIGRSCLCTQISCFYISQIQWEHYKICYSIQCCPKHMHGHAPNKVHRISCYNEWNVVVFIHILFLHIFFYSWWAYAFGCCLASL